jgi:hypothetical protein
MNLNISNPAGGPGRTLKPTPVGITSGRQRLALSVSPVAARSKAARGMTLPEMMVAVASDLSS